MKIEHTSTFMEFGNLEIGEVFELCHDTLKRDYLIKINDEKAYGIKTTILYDLPSDEKVKKLNAKLVISDEEEDEQDGWDKWIW